MKVSVMYCFRIASSWVKKFQAAATKQDLGIPQEFLSKFPMSTPIPFIGGPPPSLWVYTLFALCLEAF